MGMKIIKPIGFFKPKQKPRSKSKLQNKQNKNKNTCVKQKSNKILLQ